MEGQSVKPAPPSGDSPASLSDWETPLVEWLTIIAETFAYTRRAEADTPEYFAWVRIIREHNITEDDLANAIKAGVRDDLVQRRGMRPADLVRITNAAKLARSQKYESPRVGPKDRMRAGAWREFAALFSRICADVPRADLIKGLEDIATWCEAEGFTKQAKPFRTRLRHLLEGGE